MISSKDMELLKHAVKVAERAREKGNHPFGALLATKDGQILLEAENTVLSEKDCTGHAETNLMRLASKQYPSEFLQQCTLYSSTEPCAMCAGAIYWGGVGRVVFALSEEELLQLTGANPQNPTLNLPCREVFSRGQRLIEVEGPIPLPEALLVHAGFWD